MKIINIISWTFYLSYPTLSGLKQVWSTKTELKLSDEIDQLMLATDASSTEGMFKSIGRINFGIKILPEKKDQSSSN
jgi:hypothetical protein